MIQVDAETRELFLERVKQLLISGESTQTVKTVRGKKTVTGTSFNGDPIEQVTDTVETVRHTKLSPTPKWVYELIIKSLSVENAIALLESQGYVVVDPTIKPSEDEKESGGMTEETRDLCYSEFLGIKLEKVQELKRERLMLGFAEKTIKPKTRKKLETNSIKYHERVRKLEGSNNIASFKDDNKVFRKLPPIFFKYQQEFIEAALNTAYECLVFEKSRRIGATHALAAYAVLEASKDKSPKNFFYIGTNLPMARDFIASCAYWCKNFNLIAKFNDNPIIDKENENILVLRITFKSGKRIEALSSKPESMRGRQGHCLVDEAAFIDNLPEFLKACQAMQIWKCKVFILSTHNGVDNEFNVLCESIKKDYEAKKADGFYIQRTTLKDAVKQGLYERICLMEGLDYSLESEREWLEKLYKQAGSNAAEEYDAIPKISNPNAVFKRDYFKKIGKDELPKSFDVIGRFWDFASTSRDTSFYSVGTLVGVKGDKKYIIDCKWCRPNPGASDDFYLEVTRADGKKIVSLFELEGGSMAMRYTHYLKQTLKGFMVRECKPEGSKILRSLPVKESAKNGEYFIVDADWVDDYLTNLCQFDGTKVPLVTDLADSLSGAHENLSRKINHLLTS